MGNYTFPAYSMTYSDGKWSQSVRDIMAREDREKTRSLSEPMDKSEEIESFIDGLVYDKGIHSFKFNLQLL